MTGGIGHGARLGNGVPFEGDESGLPFRDPATETSDLRFIRRFQPETPPSRRSALTSADDFIAESAFKRTVRKVLGRKPLIPISVAAALALVAIPTGLRLTATSSTAKPSSEAQVTVSTRSSHGADASETQVAQPERVAKTASIDEEPRQRSNREARAGLDATTPVAPAPQPSFSLGARQTMGVTDLPPPSADVANTTAAAPVEPAKPVAEKPPRDMRKLDALIERGNQLLASGEIAGARLFFERAHSQDDSRGALGLGRSHDPLVLKSLAVVGQSGNEAEAERWYRRARELDADPVQTTARTISAGR